MLELPSDPFNFLEEEAMNGVCHLFIRMVLTAIDSAPDIAEDVGTLPDEPIYDEDEADYEEIRSRKVKSMMAVLNVSERKVVEHVFGFCGPEKSIKEVAKVMHVQVARIREIYNKTLSKMEMVNFPASRSA